MKTLKLIALSLCFMLTYGAATGKQQESKAEKLTVNYALKTYVDAIHHGKLQGLAQIIDENARFTMKRGNQLISNTKEEILRALKRQENVEQNCQVTQSTVETLPNQIIVKIDMKYRTFTRINYVTLSETNRDGWKVTHVSSTFE
jgi:hypothetical protein